MADSNANPGLPSTSPRRGFWRRLLFRGILVGGVCVVLFLIFLIAITVPNLRREVTPPEISGPGQVERNESVPSTPPSSGTQPFLNLDDYPHVSPTLRKLAQAWLDRVPETDKTLDTITDPALRAQVREFLKERRRIQTFLNLPLKWDKLTRLEWGKGLAYSEIPNPTMPTIEGYGDWNQLLETYPEFGRAFEEERSWASVLGERMRFEFEVHGERWDSAALYCTRGDHYSNLDLQEWEGLNSWEEEIYCLQQMGVPGWACLAGRSYQRAFDSRRQGQPPANQFQYYLRLPGYLPLFGTLAARKLLPQENESAPKNPD